VGSKKRGTEGSPPRTAPSCPGPIAKNEEKPFFSIEKGPKPWAEMTKSPGGVKKRDKEGMPMRKTFGKTAARCHLKKKKKKRNETRG